MAEEIPDDATEDGLTEDERDILVVSDEEEGHVNEQSKEALLSVGSKLRPVDMLPTHAGGFQEEDSYHMQMLAGKPRAQTTMAYMPIGSQIGNGKRQLSGQN